jgi:hypothetical protein
MKFCNTCKESKSFEEFSRCSRSGYQPVCKVCQRIASKANYNKNKQPYIERAEKARLEMVLWYKEYKNSVSCECGESRPWVLDFHHIDPKTKKFEVSNGSRISSLRLLKEEITKCKVLCANCHRDLHYKIKNMLITHDGNVNADCESVEVGSTPTISTNNVSLAQQKSTWSTSKRS